MRQLISRSWVIIHQMVECLLRTGAQMLTLKIGLAYSKKFEPTLKNTVQMLKYLFPFDVEQWL